MNIQKRDKKWITCVHGMHVYVFDVSKLCYHQEDGADDARYVIADAVECSLKDCPACAEAAAKRGIAGYRVPAAVCWPVDGDAEAMEMHVRARMAKGKEKKAALAEVLALLEGGDGHAWARLERAAGG